MRKLIFVPTIHSTGTWFCLELLKSHKSVTNFITEKTFVEKKFFNLDGTIIFHHHFDNTQRDLSDFMNHSDKIVVTVRDPLLSLLTANARKQGGETLYHIIDGFLTLIDWASKYDIFLLPVDLYYHKSVMERYFLLRNLFDFVEFDYEPYISWWAHEWPIFNTVGPDIGRSYKNLYHSRNIAGVSELVPEYYKTLVKHESILRPFLESLGYRGLLWWTS